MVEKIVLTPLGVRGLGNIVDGKDTTDYTTYEGALATGTDTINGQTFHTNTLRYSEYTIGLGFNTGTKELYIQADSGMVDSFTFANKQIVLSTSSELITDFGFDEDNKQLYLEVDD